MKPGHKELINVYKFQNGLRNVIHVRCPNTQMCLHEFGQDQVIIKSKEHALKLYCGKLTSAPYMSITVSYIRKRPLSPNQSFHYANPYNIFAPSCQ